MLIQNTTFVTDNLQWMVGKTIPCVDLDQRGMADKIESMAQAHFKKIYPVGNSIYEYHDPKTVRSIDDFSLFHKTRSNAKQIVLMDVKTHDTDRTFSMPNLISAERLFKLYSDKDNYFGLAIIDYEANPNTPDGRFSGNKIITNARAMLIEEISWSCLHIQNLGTGQIQIKNLGNKIIKFNGTRQEWLDEFYQAMIDFTSHTIKKITKRHKQWEERFNGNI